MDILGPCIDPFATHTDKKDRRRLHVDQAPVVVGSGYDAGESDQQQVDLLVRPGASADTYVKQPYGQNVTPADVLMGKQVDWPWEDAEVEELEGYVSVDSDKISSSVVNFDMSSDTVE